ncbi:MAG: alpha/beta fold hydrolase [Microcystaceae cyanobacterium]
MPSIQGIILIITTIYQAIACQLENRYPPPGQLVEIGTHRLHISTQGEGQPTIILDHSLGGIEGYLLIKQLSKLSKVCIYDRAGYGWSEPSPHPRTSHQIVKELEQLLTKANISPPYILVGDSFGSYNVRLYHHFFPEKVLGMVLTDGLYEEKMLKMPFSLKGLKLFFLSGFIMSILGSFLGIIRVIKMVGIFELLKPELRKFSRTDCNWIKRSFCRSHHWITMSREILNLDQSGHQLSKIEDLGDLPLVNIKSKSFFKPNLVTHFLPLKTVDRLREEMHDQLKTLSTNSVQIEASESGHFVWVDQPHLIVEAVQIVLDKINK